MTDDDDEIDQMRVWVAGHWDPELTLGAWWAQLAGSGYAAPHWPRRWFGKGWSPSLTRRSRALLRDMGVPGPCAGLGMMLAGPTVLTHGTDEQRERFLPGIVGGTANWCQLFSEPGAGSDLASVSTTATRDGDRWIVNGEKVWTSNGHLADWGMLLARTGPTEQKHAGLTWIAIEMDQPVIEVRPLREMTGRSLFTQVFLDGAIAFEHNVVGGVGSGWSVAKTTLANERSGLGEGGAVGAHPGSKAGWVDRRAGDVARAGANRSRASGTALAMRGRSFEALLSAATQRPEFTPIDPMLRQHLARLWTLEQIATWNGARWSATSGGHPAGPSLGKLLQSQTVRLAREVASSVLGAHGTCVGPTSLTAGVLQEMVMFASATSIYGGSDEIQRNIIGERHLGLLRDPFSD